DDPPNAGAHRASRSLRRRELARKLRQLLFRNDLATSRYSKGSLHETYRDRLFARPNYQRLNVIRPLLQSLAYSVRHLRSVVHASNASLVAGDVIEGHFYNMRKHAKLSHLCCASAAKIVETPRG